MQDSVMSFRSVFGNMCCGVSIGLPPDGHVVLADGSMCCGIFPIGNHLYTNLSRLVGQFTVCLFTWCRIDIQLIDSNISV
jgi:hypothetical protein